MGAEYVRVGENPDHLALANRSKQTANAYPAESRSVGPGVVPRDCHLPIYTGTCPSWVRNLIFHRIFLSHVCLPIPADCSF